MRVYLYVRTLTLFHTPGPPAHGLRKEVPFVAFAQANLLTARLVEAVQSKESSNGANEEGNESDEGYESDEDDEGNEGDEEHEESC